MIEGMPASSSIADATGPRSQGGATFGEEHRDPEAHRHRDQHRDAAVTSVP
jgi:hypothetical protein